MKSILSSAFILLLFQAHNCFAQERFLNITLLRSMAMGNAYHALCDDAASLPCNPAAMCRLKKVEVEVHPLIIGINDYFGSFETLARNEEIASFLKGDKPWADLSPEAVSVINQPRTVGLSASPLNISFAIPTETFFGSMGFGLYIMNGDLDGHLDTSGAIPVLSYEGLMDTVFVIGSTYKANTYLRNFPGTLTWGLNIKNVTRKKVTNTVSVDTITKGTFQSNIRTATGMGFDFGLMYTPPNVQNCVFTAVYADINSLALYYEDGEKTEINGRIHLGMRWKPQKIYYWKNKSFSTRDSMIVTAEASDFGLGIEPSRMLHFGFEYDFGKIVYRMGFNQGWVTYGFKFFNLVEYAYYQEYLETSFSGYIQPLKKHYLGFQFKI